MGDFYEAIGIDACILVEYAGLNPFGGLRPESIPKAGCPVVVLGLSLQAPFFSETSRILFDLLASAAFFTH